MLRAGSSLIESLEPRRLLAGTIHAGVISEALSDRKESSVIVFCSDRVGGKYDIFSMRPDGSHVVNLTNSPAATDAIPQVSDDGTKIAFASDRGHPGNIDIWLMDIDGTHLVNITHNGLPGATNWDPAPSPDNKTVLYMGPGTGNYDIWLSDANGTHARNITNGRGGDFASWSDDGTKIVFGSAGSDGQDDIFYMDADGSHVHQVTNSPGRDFYPAFNHDATKIAFTTERTGNREIFECNLDGSGLKNLTNSPFTDQVPYYSPEGDQISFSSSRDGDMEVYIMDADGSHQHRITNNPASDVYPGWGEAGHATQAQGTGTTSARPASASTQNPADTAVSFDSLLAGATDWWESRPSDTST